MLGKTGVKPPRRDCRSTGNYVEGGMRERLHFTLQSASVKTSAKDYNITNFLKVLKQFVGDDSK